MAQAHNEKLRTHDPLVCRLCKARRGRLPNVGSGFWIDSNLRSGLGNESRGLINFHPKRLKFSLSTYSACHIVQYIHVLTLPIRKGGMLQDDASVATVKCLHILIVH